MERERDGDEHHDEIDKREGELRVQIDEIFPNLEPRRLEPADIISELPEAHRGDLFLDPHEVLDVLLQVQRRRTEGDRLDRAVGADLAVGTVRQLPARRGPVRAPRVQPIDETELAVHLEDSHPIHLAGSRVQQFDAIEARVAAPHPEALT